LAKLIVESSRNGMAKELTKSERQTLLALEAVIEDAANRQMALAKALLTIRDRRLYRAQYGTFEEYCQERWNCSAEQGRRLCKWAEILDNVGDALPPIGGILERESHARPLALLTRSQQHQAARRLATMFKPTAADIQSLCQEISRTPANRSGPPVERMEEPAGMTFLSASRGSIPLAVLARPRCGEDFAEVHAVIVALVVRGDVVGQEIPRVLIHFPLAQRFSLRRGCLR
jgi:hypothetical protein